MSNLKSNFLYNTLLTVTGLITPLITFPYVTRILGPEGIGLSNFANSIVQFFLIITALGIPLYGVKLIAQAKNNIIERTQIFKELIVIRAVLTFFVLFIYIALVFTLKQTFEHINFYLWGIAVLIINIFEINWLFSGIEDFKYITIRSLIIQIIQIVCLFLVVKSKNDVLIYFLLPFLFSLITIVINLKYARNFLLFEDSLKKLELRKHLKPLSIIFLSLAAISLYNLFDTVLLGLFKSDFQVGIYTAAMKINRIPIAFIMALVPIMIPRISVAVAENNINEIIRLSEKTILFVITFSIPIMGVVFFLAPEIIHLLAGKDFLQAVSTIRIISPIALIIGLTNNFSMQLLIPLGKEKQLLYAVLIGAFISIILDVILIPIFDENGAAITNVLSELAVLIACFIFTNKTIKIAIPYKSIVINLITVLPIFPLTLIARNFFNSDTIILVCVLLPYLFIFLLAQIFILKNYVVRELILSTLGKFGISNFSSR